MSKFTVCYIHFGIMHIHVYKKLTTIMYKLCHNAEIDKCYSVLVIATWPFSVSVQKKLKDLPAGL